MSEVASNNVEFCVVERQQEIGLASKFSMKSNVTRVWVKQEKTKTTASFLGNAEVCRF